MKKISTKKPVRYAVVGLGHIAQAAILPSFKHAQENSQLTALVSGNEEKRQALKEKYGVEVYGYDQYEDLLTNGDIDAVYIALPNSMHAPYAIQAAKHGVHVLCEKPMAVTEEECDQMVTAAEENQVKLMIAYRLHFEQANMEAVRLAESGEIGSPRFFSSVFSLSVKDGNYRVKPEEGGGTLYDLGVYCINAARYLFRSEPTEVFAWSANDGEKRFKDIDEMTSVILRFPDERLAQFTTSFGAGDTSAFDLVGSKGFIRMDPAYEYVGQRALTLSVREKEKQKWKFGPVDQFGPEIFYFSTCLQNDEDPEPDGHEGWMDVRIIRAALESARLGRPVKIDPMPIRRRPDTDQIINLPPVEKPEMVETSASSQ